MDRSWTLGVWRKGWPNSGVTAAAVGAVDAVVVSFAGMQQVAEMGRLGMGRLGMSLSGIVERPPVDWSCTVVARYQNLMGDDMGVTVEARDGHSAPEIGRRSDCEGFDAVGAAK